ncbi:MAG: hypothetical protein FWD76_05290 [Firmicutes bacterium]|nr:hypothetical protein [Bacillota bacterium]
MEIVKSTQGGESVKSTGKQWLARMTKKRWVAVMSLSLCFVFCMSFGLQAVFRDKVYSQNEVVETTNYEGVKQDIKVMIEAGREMLATGDKSDAGYAATESIVEAYLPNLLSLLNENPGFVEIMDYYNNFFGTQRIDLYRQIANAKIEQGEGQYTAGVENRGSKKIGTYSNIDISGLKWLQSEANTWGVITGCFGALAVLQTIAGLLALLVPVVGPAASAIFESVAALYWVAFGLSWGIMASANKAMSDVSNMMERQKGYSVYKETGFLGITTGYSVYEA